MRNARSFISMLLMLLFCLPKVSASPMILNCEAGAVSGKAFDFSISKYDKHYPSIFMDIEEKLILYAYMKNNYQHKFEYRIVESSEKLILGIESKSAGTSINTISFDLESLEFSTAYLGGGLNTLKFGKCLKSL